MTIRFLVTSAIKSDFGQFNHAERKTQTIETISSIQKYAPGCPITLFESSANAVSSEDLHGLEVDEIINFSANSMLLEIANYWNNTSIVKNLSETYSLSLLLNDWTCSEQTVFKLSGRYQLTDKFDLLEQTAYPNHFVFKDRWANTWPDYMTDIEHQYPTFAYSWPSKDNKWLSEIFQLSHKLILDHVNNGRYCDVEHALYNFIPEEKVKLINKEFVVGITANG